MCGDKDGYFNVNFIWLVKLMLLFDWLVLY